MSAARCYSIERGFEGSREYTLLPLWICLVTAFCACTMGQFGDLAESLISIPTAYICLRIFYHFAG